MAEVAAVHVATLASCQWGDPKGRPVWFLHGLPGSRLVPGPLRDPGPVLTPGATPVLQLEVSQLVPFRTNGIGSERG